MPPSLHDWTQPSDLSSTQLLSRHAPPLRCPEDPPNPSPNPPAWPCFFFYPNVHAFLFFDASQSPTHHCPTTNHPHPPRQQRETGARRGLLWWHEIDRALITRARSHPASQIPSLIPPPPSPLLPRPAPPPSPTTPSPPAPPCSLPACCCRQPPIG